MIEVYSDNFNGIWFGVACFSKQIVASSFGETQQETLSRVLGNLPFNTPFQVLHQPTDTAKNALVAIEAIFLGKGFEGNLNLALTHLPTYTQKVLKATAQVPLGYVTFYGSLAKAVGGGPRAVGNVMAKNPFAPIVPCHRVVKTDFTLGGYGMGLKVKVAILGKEKRGFQESTQVPVNGSSLEVYPVEFVLRSLA
jgi:O-6-methylguanine DNA methyltransferase